MHVIVKLSCNRITIFEYLMLNMNAHNFPSFLASLNPNPCLVLDRSIPLEKYTPIDLSINNSELDSFEISSSKAWEQYITDYCKHKNALVVYGGYLEKRNLYNRSDYFNSTQSGTERNIHLGIDLWISAGSQIFVPIEGEVHSFANNTNFGDYGPTIILKHHLKGFQFYTLYGHLSLESIQQIKIGQFFEVGDPLATLGTAKVNGDYAPHLHFQIIRDIADYQGDYPGVCSQSEVAYYRTNCPDPNLLLKLY